MNSRIVSQVGAFTLLVIILLLAGWIRTLGRAGIPEGQFTENDAYLYYWQADIISKQGQLPQRDMHRWLPTGRDLKPTLNLYSYITAYTHKLITLFFPDVTLYQLHVFAPVIFFILGLGVVYLFLYNVFGIGVAAPVGILLAVIPGCLERSAVGCSDRDSWCWLLGILVVITYLWKEQIHRRYIRLLLSGMSGFFMFLGGLSWEGFGVFMLVILVVELWRFLSSETEAESHLVECLIWVIMFVPWLYVFSPAYRQGTGFSTHLAAIVLVPPLAVLALRCFRHFLTTHRTISAWIQQYISGRAIALILTSSCLLFGLVYVLIHVSTFTNSTVPFSFSPLMQNVTELLAPKDFFWEFRYGAVYWIGSIGLIYGCIKLWRKKGIVLSISVCFLTLATFFREYLYTLLSPIVCEYLFYFGITFVPITALGVAVLRKSPVKHELIYIAAAVWLFIWLALARGAKRYDFFIGFPIVLFATLSLRSIIAFLSQLIEQYLNKRTETQQISLPVERTVNPVALKRQRKRRRNSKSNEIEKTSSKGWETLMSVPVRNAILTAILLALLLFWLPPARTETYHLAKRGVFTVKEIRTAIPGHDTPQGLAMSNTFQWMKTEHIEKEKPVVAAGWSYGSALNVLGGVMTIIDQDHFIPHWIHLYSRHVFCALSEREALEFLYTHDATYLMLTESEVLHPLSTSTVGSNEKQDRQFDMEIMHTRIPVEHPAKYRMLPEDENSSITFVHIDFTTPVDVTAKLKIGKDVKLPYVTFFENGERITNEYNHNQNGGILHHYNDQTKQDNIYYIPPHGWNSLAVKLFFRQTKSQYFIPVFPQKDFSAAKVKVWKIQYPKDMKKNPSLLVEKQQR